MSQLIESPGWSVDHSVDTIGLSKMGLSLICAHGENGFNVLKCVLRTSSYNACLN